MLVCALLVSLVAGACREDGVELRGKAKELAAADSLEAAAAGLRSLVDETAAEVIPEHPTRPLDGNDEPGECIDELGGASGEVRTRYLVRSPLRPDDDPEKIARSTEELWREQGLETLFGHAGDTWSVHVRLPGYGIGLTIDEERGFVELGGSTPCFERP